ncbi:3-dehydroquinate synthase [Candidatus Methylacidithermus pantelleriae]|nr:3-dehydroquinate synthase [Candidatus Methylacidithermus pantelleriae]
MDKSDKGVACTVWVDLGKRSYPVRIGVGLRHRLDEELQRIPGCSKVTVVCDETTAALFADDVEKPLQRAGYSVVRVVVPPGELSKSVAQLENLWRRWAQAQLGRDGVVVALGGGVVGDLAGFAASVYLRGVRWVGMPTTLLAMVDSAIGGKTGIDLPEGKNLVGSFYQPCLVLEDLEVLDHLPPREFRSGMAEVIKYGCIADPSILSLASSGHLSREALTELVARCVQIKAQVVEEDEQEKTGKRMILNFGHTLGHAVEAASGYQKLLHGEAVAVGMWGAALLSHWKSGLSAEELDRIYQALVSQGLPRELPGMNREKVQDALLVDKKKRNHTLRWVLLRSLGSPCIRDDVTPQELERVFEFVFPRGTG